MSAATKTLHVSLPAGRYPIHIGPGVLGQELGSLATGLTRELVFVVTNETLARLYPDAVDKALRGSGLRVETCVLPDGEQYKTLETLATVYDRLFAAQANRKTLMLAFGGGVVGDTAGFAAATFMRGMPLVQVPTTLLAQVDSSVGGKTAVNHPRGKNGIGAFKQPSAVLIDLDFLKTLPQRERAAGLFELIKHGIIRDRALFGFLEEKSAQFGDAGAGFWSEAIQRSCAIKAAVVEADETEQDLRAILNFGHTLAHLIETHTGYAQVLHGEAVGIGMLFAAYVSRAWGHLPGADYDRIAALLGPLLRPVRMPGLEEEGFAALMLHDKKAANQSLRFILLGGLGEVFIREGTRPAELWPLFLHFLDGVPHALAIEAHKG